jgi:uncharacterized protein YbjT (DUF2867 family)
MTILVTGARGVVARSLVRQLVAAGAEVRSGSRVPDASQPSGLTFDGVSGMFLYADRGGLDGLLGEALAAGVSHVVLLSAAGADPSSSDAITRLHGEAEEAVTRSGMAWTFLRPGGFATNRLLWAATVRSEGVVYEAFPDSHSSLIHEDDIAAVALCALTSAGHEEARYTLTGPSSLTVREQASLIGEVVDRPVRVVRQSLADYRRSLSRWPAEIVEARIQRISALVDHPDPTTDTVFAVTGRPARSFGSWAADHASDFSGS